MKLEVFGAVKVLLFQLLSNKANAADCSGRFFKVIITRYAAPAQPSDRTFHLPDYQAKLNQIWYSTLTINFPTKILFS
jgi:hypothetical protein